MSVIKLNKREVRKVIRVGNSLGITIPNDFIASANLHLGDEIEIIGNDNEIVLRPIRKAPSSVRPDVLELFAETFNEYEDVLRTLRDK